MATIIACGARVRPASAAAGTSLHCAPCHGSHNDSTPCRMPYVLSTPALPRDLRQNIRLYGYAGGVALASASCAPSQQVVQKRRVGVDGGDADELPGRFVIEGNTRGEALRALRLTPHPLQPRGCGSQRLPIHHQVDPQDEGPRRCRVTNEQHGIHGDRQLRPHLRPPAAEDHRQLTALGLGQGRGTGLVTGESPFFVNPEMGPIRFQERKMATIIACGARVRPASAAAGTSLRCAPCPGSHNDSTPCRMPYVLSTPALPRDLRQNIRLYGYAGGVALASASCAPSRSSSTGHRAGSSPDPRHSRAPRRGRGPAARR